MAILQGTELNPRVHPYELFIRKLTGSRQVLSLVAFSAALLWRSSACHTSSFRVCAMYASSSPS